MVWLHRLAALLGHPRFPWLAALCGLALASPALMQGLVLDDHLHRLYVGQVTAGTAPGHWWDLYAVATDAQTNRAAMDLGASPWWTLPDLRVRFFRPLSAATHHLDHRLWPQATAVMHAHSLLWYAALVVAVGTLLRRWLAIPWVAGLATLLFAVDDGHATAAAWLAQRNALVSAFFVVVALIAHDRNRRDAWGPGRILGVTAWAAALCAGEAAIAGSGYLVAHALWLDDEPGRASRWSRRMFAWGRRMAVALWPYVVVTLGWVLAYRALGYGAHGSGVYLDPLTDTAMFVAALPDRASALLVGQLGGIAADTWALEPAPWTAARRGGVAIVAGLALLVFIARRPAGWGADRGLVVCIVGAGAAVVPTAAAIPSDRLLLLVGIGASAAVAAPAGWAATAVEARMGAALRAVAGVAALAGLWVHLVRASLAFTPAVEALPVRLEQAQADALRGIPSDPGLTEQQLVIVNSPPTLVPASLWIARADGHAPLPRGLRLLGSTFAPVIVQRLDPHTLVLQPVGGYLGDPFTTIVRGPGHSMTVGDRVQLDGWSVEIMGMAQGRPTVVRVRFERPFDDPSFRLITWNNERFAPFVLPPVGATTVSPPPAQPRP